MRAISINVAGLLTMMLVIPIYLSAQFSGGSGTATDPYLIASASDLDNIRHYPGLYFMQTCDINLNVAPYNVASGWSPIGSNSSLYHYDGHENKIIGLTRNQIQLYGMGGLFQGLSGGYIRNVIMEDFDIESTKAGALAYSCAGTIIENCHVSGTFSECDYPGDWVGGLFGTTSNFSSLNNCSAWIAVSGYMPGVGGIVGLASDSSIDSCRAYVDISSSCSLMGGLAAKVHNSTVTYSIATGIQAGFAGCSGGLIGEISASDVSSCFANLEMMPDEAFAGGLAGMSHSGSVISNCHSNAWFSGGLGGYACGFIPFMYGTQLINCYSNSVQNDASCLSAVGFVESDCSVTNSYYNYYLMTPEGDDEFEFPCGRWPDAMTWPYQYNTYSGWDFQNVWQDDQNYELNSGYPRLRNLDYSCFVPSPKYNIPQGSYSHSLYFEISCADPEAVIHYTLDGSKPDIFSPIYTGAFEISSPLTVKARAYKPGLFPSPISIADIWTSPAVLAGSGTTADPYRIFNVYQFFEIGTHLDDHFKLFENIDLEDYSTGWQTSLPFGKFSGFNAADNRPFTGSLEGNGHVIYGAQISGTDQGAKGLFAYCNGAVITDLQLSFDSVQGNSHTGYLAGVMVDSEVIRCLASGDVVSANGKAGLLIGQAEGCLIDQCFSIGSVSGVNCNGGLIGNLIDGSVSDSYSLADVTEAPISGGLIGALSGPGLVERCYSAGLVSGEGTGNGGLIGSANPEMVTDSFWDTQSSGQTQSAGGTGCTTAQMHNEGTYVNWDLQHIWFPPVSSYNLGYPRLRHNQVTVSAEEEVPAPSLLSFWPNPFRSDLKLSLKLARPEISRLTVFNARGQVVKHLHAGPLSSGNHELLWDGRDDSGSRLASGIYIIRLEAGGQRQTRKCVLLK